MLKLERFDLSVIIVSCRPKWLANCLAQFNRQQIGNLKVECIVVSEGDSVFFSRVIEYYGIKKHFVKEQEGLAGAYGKDLGIHHSRGDYVCFWDDDNVYYDHALATLHDAAFGSDIGIVQCGLMAFDFEVIPRDHEIRFANIDTMCLCVRRQLAAKARWSDHDSAGTDFYWLQKLCVHNPSIRFVDVKIGDHLND